MEEENICNICGKPSQAFCDCRPALTWLCSDCFGAHWKSPGRHQIHQTGEINVLSLEKRKQVTLAKTYLSERLKQIKREYGEYALRLESFERDLHQTVTNKFLDLKRILELSVKKLEQEVVTLQDQVQSFFLDQGPVTPLCGKLIAKAAILDRFLAVPIGVLQTDPGGVETQVSNLQSFRSKGLDLILGGGLEGTSLFYFADNEEALKRFDPENKEETGFPLEYGTTLSYDSSWCVIGSDDLFVCGGTVNLKKISTACFLSTSSINLTLTESMQTARSSHSVLEVAGYVYCFGGEAERSVALDTCERFHIDTATWSIIHSLPQPLTKVSSVCVGEAIYVTGYNTFKLFAYFPASDTYRPLQFTFAQSFQSACLLHIGADGDRLLILRGPDIFICEFEEDSNLRVQCKLTQSTLRTNVWEIKGSPAKREPNYYVFNFYTKSVFEIFVYGLRVEITEVVEEEFF